MSFFMSDVEQFRPVKCNKRTSNKNVTGYKNIGYPPPVKNMLTGSTLILIRI